MERRLWRWRKSRSRNPSVARKATFAPLRSSTALVATVDPCTRSPAAGSERPDSSSAAIAPRCGADGVLGTLVMRTPPSSKATRSVKVPPTSTPTRVAPLMRDPVAKRRTRCWVGTFRLLGLEGALHTRVHDGRQETETRHRRRSVFHHRTSRPRISFLSGGSTPLREWTPGGGVPLPGMRPIQTRAVGVRRKRADGGPRDIANP